MFSGTTPVAAQSQNWTAQLLVPPFGSSFVSEWERNPQNLVLSVTYLGTEPREYRIEGIVRGGRGELARGLSPLRSVAGTTTEFITGEDLVDWDVRVRQASAEQAFRAGVIPDDDYEICARVISSTGVQLEEVCTITSVTLPEAPELLYPADGQGVGTFQPTFQWTPVVLPPELGLEYRVTIVERYPHQAPATAIAANLPVYDELVGEAPLLVYPIDALDLQPGTEYVWQVEVLDAFGETLVPGGLLSPVATFQAAEGSAVGGGPMVGGGGLPDRIPLISGLATLTDLGAVDVESTLDGWTLNGPAWLDLGGPFGVRGRVRLEDLELDDFGGSVTAVDGRVTVRLATPLAVSADLPVEVTELTYTPDQGLLATAILRLPDGRELPLEGDLRVTLGGLYGEVEAVADPLWTAGADPVELELTDVWVSFPSGTVTMAGAATLFGGRARCSDLRGSVSSAGVWSVDPLCLPGLEAEVEAETAGLLLDVGVVSGPLSLDLNGGTLSYHLDAEARLSLLGGKGPCSVQLTLAVADGQPVTATNVDPQCAVMQSTLTADWVLLALSNLAVASVGYQPETGFQVDATFDVEAELPAMPAMELPALTGVTVDAGGITLPGGSLELSQEGLGLAGYGLDVGSVSIAPLAITWNDWRAARLPGFTVEMTAELGLPGLPLYVPGCLARSQPVVTRAVITDGEWTLDVDGQAGLEAGCRLPLGSDGAALALQAWAGPITLDVGTALELTSGLGVQGALELPDAFACEATGSTGTFGFDGSLVLLPDGRLDGEVTTPALSCPLPASGLALSFLDGRLTVDPSDVPQSLRLSAGVRVSNPAEPDSSSLAQGSATVDLVTGELLAGRLEVQGPIEVGIPADDPAFIFRLAGATLTPDGLEVDGRHELLFADGATMGVTFDQVRIAPSGDRLVTGRVLFDAAFALDAGIDENGALDWAAVPGDAPFTLASGLRVRLPAQVSLGVDGLAVSGDAEARLTYRGRELTALEGSFEQGFLLGTDPLAVTRGWLGLSMEGQRVAWVDASGFHPDFGAFGVEVLPTRLPLPAEAIAYLELRDENGELRLQQEDADQGVRLYTDGGTIPLVIPALDPDGTGAPHADVAVDIVVGGDLGLEVLSGTIVAQLDPDLEPALDLSSSGVPFRVRELRYESPSGTGYRWSVTGDPVLLGDPVPGTTGALTLGGDGRLIGQLTVAHQGTLPLVEGSAAVRYEHDQLTADFDAFLPAGPMDWTLRLGGALALDLTGDVTGGVRADAVVEVTPAGVAVTELTVDPNAPPVYFDLGVVDMGLENVSVPTLTYDEQAGWDFEVAFDLRLRFPELDGLTLDPVPGVILDPDGLSLPELAITGFDGGFDLEGFRISPLAVRIPAIDLSLDGFAGGLPDGWTPTFDLSVGLGPDGLSRWPDLGGLSLTVLDASWGTGGFTGTFEPRSLLQPLELQLDGDGLGLRLSAFGGSLGVVGGDQTIELQAGGELVLPDALRCTAQPGPTVTLPGTELQLFPDGGIAGRVEDLGVSCPIRFGPATLTFGSTDLVFAFVEDTIQAVNVQQVYVSGDATLSAPGAMPGTTVSASGNLSVGLGDRNVRSGSISLDTPIRWELPDDDPFVTLAVGQARLDPAGLHLTGAGSVLLPGGVTGPQVTFSDLIVSQGGEIRSGSATLAAGVTLQAVLDQGALDWSVAEPTGALGADDGFRLGLGSAVTLDSDGFGLTGTATAQLQYADSAFTALDVDFSQGFTLGTDARVSAGRADFRLDQTDIAFVDARGFFPGDLFGVIPLPSRLGLPSEDVAYLQLKDPVTGSPLVETATEQGGIRISTRSSETVDLVLPSVPAAQGGPTVVPVTFSLLANASSYALLSGSLEATAPQAGSLFDLEGLGVPLAVTRVAYDPTRPGGPQLDARARLPASLGGLDIVFQELTVTAQGLTGEAVVGSYDETSDGTPVAQADLGALTLALDGARVRFDGTPGVSLEGGLTSTLFRDPNGVRPRLDFTATLASDGTLAVRTDATSLPGSRLPLGEAEFRLMAVSSSPATYVVAEETRFALGVSGVLTFPDLAPEFSLAIKDLEVGTDGVVLPQLDLVAQTQQLVLFGATLSLRQTSMGPGLSLAYTQEELRVVLNGDIDFLGHTVEFQGLRISSSGELGMSTASLTTGPLTLVPGSVVLTRLVVGSPGLTADLDIDLPAPLDAGTQQASFTVAPDGALSGGGRIALIEEAQGLGGNRTQVGGPIVTAHLRYLGLNITPESQTAGAVEAVADLYFRGDESNRVSVGRLANNDIDPGLTVGLDGTVHWGAVSLDRDFDFDFDMLRLQVRNVTGGGTNFRLGFGGTLQVDVPVISGGVSFSGFEVTAGLGLNASEASVQGGNLKIAGVMGLSLNGFEYSPTPTTITGVRTGLLPDSTSLDATATTTDIQVASYLRFGGSLSIGGGCGEGGECLLSGGVEEFSFYRTQDDRTNLVIREATLDIPQVLSMEADLQYRDLSDGGFEILLGATADFQSREITVVGALEDGPDGNMRAGLFAISSERIEIVPVVLAITDLGGGFFYRPRPEYCQLVREYSGVPDLSSEGNSCENVGDFTGFLFAAAAVVDPNIGRAQVLLTVSETGLQLDGVMALFNASGPVEESSVRGTLNLTIGFQEAFAEGAFDITVDYSPLVTASSGLEFFVYGEDAWGIYGGADIRFLLGAIQGSADVFVGPPGFFVEGSVRAGFDVWVVSVDAWAETAAWLAGERWGAYLDVGAKAEILGGAISAEGQLQGGLVSEPGQSLLIYASALARGCVLWECGSAWVSVQWDGDFSAEFGRNSAYERRIAAVEAIRNEFERSKEGIMSEILANQLDYDLSLSDEELAGIYGRMRDGNLDQVFADAITDEYRAYPSSMKSASFNTDWWQPEAAFYSSYQDLIAQAGSPIETLATPLSTYDTRVQQGVSDLNAALPAVQGRLDEVTTEIEEIDASLPRAADLSSPIGASSYDAPQATLNPDGTKTLQSGPSVDFDAGAATDLQTTLRADQAASAAYAQEVADRIQQVEAALASADHVLKNTDVSYPLGYARRYAEVLADVEEQFARHGDVLLRQQDWYRQELQQLAGSDQAQDLMELKSNAMGLQPDGASILDNLIQIRAENLNALSDSELLADYMADADLRETNPNAFTVEDYKELATDLGMIFWNDIALAGMEAADSAAGAAFDSVRIAADVELRNRWLEHAQITARIDNAFEIRTELVAGLHALYVEWGRVWPDLETLPVRSGGTPLLSTTPTYAELQARVDRIQQGLEIFLRRQELEAELQVPTIDVVNVASKNQGYMATELYYWAGSHPGGIYEYTYNSIVGRDVGFWGSALMQSNGSYTGRQAFRLTPGRGTLTQNRTLRVGARGGAGYVGYGRSTYATRFEEGVGGHDQGTVRIFNQVADVTPPTRPVVRIGGARSSSSIHWVPSGARLDSVSWSAFDVQSQIGGYEYAVGWDGDTTGVRGWTGVGGRTSMTLTDLTLEEGPPPVPETDGGSGSLTMTDPYFTLAGGTTTSAQDLSTLSFEPTGYRVFVRARNGDGLQSSAGQSSPIRVDLRPPYFPEGAELRRRFVVAPLLYTFYTLGSTEEESAASHFPDALPACEPPRSDGLVLPTLYTGFTTLVPAETPVITLQVPDAQDQGSGVARYAWRADTIPTTEYSQAGWTLSDGLVDTLRIEGYPLDYENEFYVSLVAFDTVGRVSEPIHYGPFQVSDPSPPTDPAFCLTTGSSPTTLRLKVSDTGTDPETGVVSWDYRIRRADGSVVRDWPGSPDRTALEPGQLITTTSLPLTDGEDVYAELRVRNGRGRTAVTASGPLRVELTPPPSPTVTFVQLVRQGADLRVLLSYRTAPVGATPVTHDWLLVDPQVGVVARGPLPATDGTVRSRELFAVIPDGPLPAGTYRFITRSTTSTGLSSANAGIEVNLP